MWLFSHTHCHSLCARFQLSGYLEMIIIFTHALYVLTLCSTNVKNIPHILWSWLFRLSWLNKTRRRNLQAVGNFCSLGKRKSKMEYHFVVQYLGGRVATNTSWCVVIVICSQIPWNLEHLWEENHSADKTHEYPKWWWWFQQQKEGRHISQLLPAESSKEKSHTHYISCWWIEPSELPIWIVTTMCYGN